MTLFESAPKGAPRFPCGAQSISKKRDFLPFLRPFLTRSILGAASVVMVGMSIPTAKAETVQGAETRFAAEGLPMFPEGNLNFLKQYLITWNPRPAGFSKSIFVAKASVAATSRGAFGLEFGMCFGGNVAYDLGFKPEITLPDQILTEVPIPLVASSGFQVPTSYFTSSFPGIGQVYADLIFDANAAFVANGHVFGKKFNIAEGISTRSIPSFSASTRCAPFPEPILYGFELASINRDLSNQVRYLDFARLGAASIATKFPYVLEPLGNREIKLDKHNFGTLILNNPNIATDSRSTSLGARSCGPDLLCTTNHTDIIGLLLNVDAIINRALEKAKPPLPPLSKTYKKGPFTAGYTVAKFSIGPILKLQQDFDLRWDFTVDGEFRDTSGAPKLVRLHLPNGEAQNGSSFTGFGLTNLGPTGLPSVELFDLDPVNVTLSYRLKPNLNTKVSLPICARIKWELGTVNAGIKKIGTVELGPLTKGTKDFRVATPKVRDTRTDLDSPGTIGQIAFQLKASGHPEWDWKGSVNGNWTTAQNWQHPLAPSVPNAFSGVNISGGTTPVADINAGTAVDVGVLKVLPGGQVNVTSGRLRLNNGLLHNDGLIQVSTGQAIDMEAPFGFLCSTGTIRLINGSITKPFLAFRPPILCNFNTVEGSGSIGYYDSNNRPGTIDNAGTIVGNDPSNQLLTHANTVVNKRVLSAAGGGTHRVQVSDLRSRLGSQLCADGGNSQLLVQTLFPTDHAGTIKATNGGRVSLSPDFGAAKAVWNGGQSLDGSTGFFSADGRSDAGVPSQIELTNCSVNGGELGLSHSGFLVATDTDFTSSQFDVGYYDPTALIDAGVTLAGTCLLNTVWVNNHGSFSVASNGSATLSSGSTFINHGALEVQSNASLTILPVAADPADPDSEAVPGIANLANGSLNGGVWDISGSLHLGDMAITRIGADSLGADPDDLSDVISAGSPASVILRGENYQFSSLASLEENGGILTLSEGASFTTLGNFINEQELHILGETSTLTVQGDFIQTTGAKTCLPEGSLVSTLNNYQILGGEFLSESEGTIFGRAAGDPVLTSVRLRVESPLVERMNAEGTGTEVVPVRVDLAANCQNGQPTGTVEISTIGLSADVVIHGSAVKFRALSDWLSAIEDGTFTVSGDGLGNPGLFQVGIEDDDGNALPTPGLEISGSGTLAVSGLGSTLTVKALSQSSANATLVLDAGSQVRVLSTLDSEGNLATPGDVDISGGSLFTTIGGRPESGLSEPVGMIRADGTVTLGSSDLYVSFPFEDPEFSADIGDAWTIVSASTVTGTFASHEFFNPMLPPNSSLNVVYSANSVQVVVVSDMPLFTYAQYADDNQLSISAFSVDTDMDGQTDGEEYAEGTDPRQANEVADSLGSESGTIEINGESFFEFSYVRPGGTERRDVKVIPESSPDGTTWYASDFLITVDPITNTETEKVTLRSAVSEEEERHFFRIRKELRP
jgi:hypothetical protein